MNGQSESNSKTTYLAQNVYVPTPSGQEPGSVEFSRIPSSYEKDPKRTHQKKTVLDIVPKGMQPLLPLCSIKEARRRMQEAHFDALPVCENDRLVGIVHARDLLFRIVDQESNPNLLTSLTGTQMLVQDVMLTSVETCFEDESLETASEKMRAKGLECLVVLNRDQKVVGLIQRKDFQPHPNVTAHA